MFHLTRDELRAFFTHSQKDSEVVVFHCECVGFLEEELREPQNGVFDEGFETAQVRGLGLFDLDEVVEDADQILRHLGLASCLLSSRCLHRSSPRSPSAS